jgi:ssDNA-binding replication factor A large subunit
MIRATYDQLVQRISSSTGLDAAEVSRRIDAKRAKLSDLISKEGAAQIVAAELGISFDKQKIKVNEMLVGMRKVAMVAKVLRIFPVRTFKTKNSESKVVSMLVGDETGTVRCVLWDTNQIRLVEEGKITVGSVVSVKDAAVRGSDVKELHLSSFSEIKLSGEEIDVVNTTEEVMSKKISDFKVNDRVKTRAVIVQAFDPKFFLVCKECKKKVNLENEKYVCQAHGTTIPEERALFNVLIDDGSLNIRAVCFSDNFKKLFPDLEEADLKNPDIFIVKKQDLLGKEFFFSGKVRLNKVFNTQEFIITDIEEVNTDQLINELSK